MAEGIYATQEDRDSKLAMEAVVSLGRLRTLRMNWESYWENCAELGQPAMSMTFFNNLIVEGQKKDQKRFDGTAEIALGRFASAMESILTPRNTLWHNLATDDASLNRRPRVRLWFDTARDVLFKYRYDYDANFASQCNEHYMSLGLLGTGATFIDRLQSFTKPRGFRYSHIHLGWIYFDQNHQGITDTVYRPFKMKARNCLQKFKENCPETILKAAIGNNPDELFDIIHCVHPNYEKEYGRKDYRGMNFLGYYVAQTEQKIIEMSGYNSFPFCISRYMTAPGEMYGRSPMMQCLTNVRVLNQQKQTHLKQGQRVVDPVLLMHDDGVTDFSLKPGAMNGGMINSRGQKLVDVLPTGNLAVNEKMMQMEKDEINSAFLTDLFQILKDSPSRMTTVEVMERAKEKGILMAPTMGRQESEFLGPMIERELDLARQQNLIPPMPPELIEAGSEYKIIYDSPLARAQKAEQAAGTMRMVQWASEVSQMTQDPSPLDNFDFDEIIPDLSYNQAVPVRYMASQEKKDAKRKARAQAQAQQQVVQAGPAVAQIAAQSQTAKQA